MAGHSRCRMGYCRTDRGEIDDNSKPAPSANKIRPNAAMVTAPAKTAGQETPEACASFRSLSESGGVTASLRICESMGPKPVQSWCPTDGLLRSGFRFSDLRRYPLD